MASISSTADADPTAGPTPVSDQRSSSPSRRMLVIVNPYASTVSDRLRNLVLYALDGRYEVEAIETQGRGHATELCREAAHEGYDVVVAFGGDGTVNEAINGLAGSPTPLTCLPGGATNVYCRILGIPSEIVDATEHLLGMADDWRPRQVDLGVVNERHFAFSAGLGLDASVVRRVDEHARLKRRLGAYYFTYAALTTFSRRYLLSPPRLVVSVGASTSEADLFHLLPAAPDRRGRGRSPQRRNAGGKRPAPGPSHRHAHSALASVLRTPSRERPPSDRLPLRPSRSHRAQRRRSPPTPAGRR